MWRNVERPIAHLIVTVDRHKRRGYVAQSDSSLNPFKMT